MEADRNHLYGLVGFVVSGLIFLVAAILNRDWWTFAGATVWIVACGFWIVPYTKR